MNPKAKPEEMTRKAKRREMIQLLAERWEERPDCSLGRLIAEMTYNAAGHTVTGEVSDAELLDGLRHGWKPL